MSQEPFRERTALLLGAAVVTSFLATLAFWISGVGEVQPPPAGSDAFSVSALGHRGVVELLRSRDVPVVVSQQASLSRVGPGGLLIVAEPDTGTAMRRSLLDDFATSSSTTLVVLPKWIGEARHDGSGWVQSVKFLRLRDVEEVLELLDCPGDVLRFNESAELSWFDSERRVSLPRPQLMGALSGGLKPLVSSPDGVLLAARDTDEGGRLLVLSDPDLLANHGLYVGDNAFVAVDLVGRLLEPGSVVIVDETLHGFATKPRPWSALLRFPLVLIVFQALVVLVILIWSAMGRFGAALREVPALEAGKRVLVENTSDLLLGSGHSGAVVRRYLEHTERRTAEAFHLPVDLSRAERGERLAQIGEQRATGPQLPDLVEGLSRSKHHGPAELLRIARKIHRWNQEMIHGTR